MSRYDAENTKWHLEQARRAAKPLKDADLSRRIDETITHIEKKLDPKVG